MTEIPLVRLLYPLALALLVAWWYVSWPGDWKTPWVVQLLNSNIAARWPGSFRTERHGPNRFNRKRSIRFPTAF